MRRRVATIGALLASGLFAFAAPAGADWTAYHEGGALNAADHSSGRAARLRAAWKATGMHGAVWSEPLVYRGLVIVATEANDVYAFRERTGARVWHARLGSPVPASELPCGDISPTLGITSTPVIDRRTGTLYAVADLRSGASAHHTLFALAAGTGRRRFSRSVEPPSNPLNQLQRESLALDRGRVLIGYGGNDGDCAQYRGFLVSAPANGRGPNAIYGVPTSREGAIWSGGGSPAVDAAGDVFVPTGNAANGPGQSFDHGDTLEKLGPRGSQLDYWAPASWARDSASDADLGSVSPELLPGHLAYQGGKNGQGYLVSTRHLGHIGGELFSAPVCTSFGSDAYAAGTLFVACSEGIHALTVKTAAHRFAPRWSGPSDADGPPILAAGRVWVTSTGDSLLYGLDPRTGAIRARASTPAMEHFSTPAASGGRLFLATDQTLNAYTIGTAASSHR
jgi:polyvinyl alcohol dehydrogenase (cytochrome)